MPGRLIWPGCWQVVAAVVDGAVVGLGDLAQAALFAGVASSVAAGIGS